MPGLTTDTPDVSDTTDIAVTTDNTHNVVTPIRRMVSVFDDMVVVVAYPAALCTIVQESFHTTLAPRFATLYMVSKSFRQLREDLARRGHPIPCPDGNLFDFTPRRPGDARFLTQTAYMPFPCYISAYSIEDGEFGPVFDFLHLPAEDYERMWEAQRQSREEQRQSREDNN